MRIRRTGVPLTVWRSVVGRSRHRGCPVGRSQLRLIRMNYWGYDEYRHRGGLVVRGYVTQRVVATFRELYRRKYPIRHMYRVDRFGWSKYLEGANDYRSTKAGNTSAFDCREVVGRPSVQSPQTYGRSIDLNLWENPYVTHFRDLPERVAAEPLASRYAWRSSDHAVVRAFSARGFSWARRTATTTTSRDDPTGRRRPPALGSRRRTGLRAWKTRPLLTGDTTTTGHH